ncbi:hypothetical protein ACOSQ2_020058 [Xanthoceras sorbifolium]
MHDLLEVSDPPSGSKYLFPDNMKMKQRIKGDSKSLFKRGFEGRESRLAAVVALPSSLDYTTSKSTLKLLLPLADPAQALNVPLLKKLVLNYFCTIPAKLILQLTTAFREGGLCDRSGKFFYKDHLHKGNVPILAIAGDQDLVCPPEAVKDTVKLLPENLVTYKVFGEAGGPHYAHYDLVGGRLAVEQVYPCIVEFLSLHDSTS